MITGERNREGEFLLTFDSDTEIKDAVLELLTTETGRRYKKEFYDKERGGEDFAAAVGLAQKKTGREAISNNELRSAFQVLMTANVIPRRSDEANWQQLTAPPEPEDTRLRDRNGKILSESQLKWRVFRIYCEGDEEQGIPAASMEDIQRRKREDPEFAVFVRKNWEQQLANSTKENVPDAVVPANQRTKDGRKVSPELLSFAEAYVKEPIEHLRPKGGFVVLGSKQMSWTEFTTKQKAAAEAGLI